MLKDALQYLVSLKDNKTYNLNGEIYSDRELHRVAKPVYRPEEILVTGLDSIVKLVRRELDKNTLPLFVRVADAKTVCVYTTLDKFKVRDRLYKAVCDVPGFREGFRSYETSIIELRSQYSQGEDVNYLLDLLSRMNTENGVTTKDNGVSQEVEARQGVSLKSMVPVRPRVSLRPYRTFLEVEQPESEFLLRLDNEGNVGLFEADGGMWKLEAKRNICEFFERELKEFVDAGTVVVMM